MSSLFGGSKSSSTQTSYNQAYPQLSAAFSPVLDYASQGGNAITKLLGGDSSGLDSYKNAMGYDWAANRGATSVVANNAVKGLRNSGSTLKGLANFQSGLDNQYASSYLDNLFNLSNLGLNAGNTISGAGNYSTGTSTSTQSSGAAGGIGGLLAGAAKIAPFLSDRRLKKNITKTGELEDGLGTYTWHYLWESEDDDLNTGHMADEVERLRPWALGPEINGFKTVNYGAI